ncbi:hypothetical protein ACIQYS_04675 [Psychrobacillus sp. NPDC096426]|uniref:hypothetical protein n=1 Tax=Psychrobacillus sp. NPDC096426 TaxID=3364491 RepID=UPI0038051D73
MSKINYILYFLSGMIVGVFLVVPFLEWIGMPSFANILVYLFGELNEANKFVVSLFSVLLILLIIMIPIRKYKKTP